MVSLVLHEKNQSVKMVIKSQNSTQMHKVRHVVLFAGKRNRCANVAENDSSLSFSNFIHFQERKENKQQVSAKSLFCKMYTIERDAAVTLRVS